MTDERVRVEVKVLLRDFPLSCPLPNMTLWNMHPRVYLATNENDEAICPYCSTIYTVVDE